MNNTNTSVKTESFNSARISSKAKEIYQTVRNNTAVKIIGSLAVLATGLLLLGSLFRVLAWTAIGYNQLAGALAGKKG